MTDKSFWPLPKFFELWIDQRSSMKTSNCFGRSSKFDQEVVDIFVDEDDASFFPFFDLPAWTMVQVHAVAAWLETASLETASLETALLETV